MLMTLANTLEQERRKKRLPHGRAIPSIKFVREGQKPPTTATTRTNLLQKAQSWEMKVDLGGRLKFPQVVQTTLRPDAVLWSEEAKKIILIELTVPWEEGCEQAFERKSAKYQDLLHDCRGKGWQAWLFPVEVGCRGFPAQSVWRMLTAIGVTGRERKTAARRMGEAAERASCWLWSRREEISWKLGELMGSDLANHC